MYCCDLNLPQPQFAKVVFVKPTIPKNLIYVLQIAIICQISGEHFGSSIDLLSVDLSTPLIVAHAAQKSTFYSLCSIYCKVMENYQKQNSSRCDIATSWTCCSIQQYEEHPGEIPGSAFCSSAGLLYMSVIVSTIFYCIDSTLCRSSGR